MELTREEKLKEFYEKYCDKDFYSVYDLHQVKDIHKNYPRVMRVSSNRSDGKTTNIITMCTYLYLKYGEQFIIFVRNKYEAEKVYKRFDTTMEILNLRDYEFTTNRVGEIYREMCLVRYDDNHKITDSQTIGFAIPVKNPDLLRDYSGDFKKVERAVFDEFQLESGEYLEREVEKVMSALVSVCRGYKKHSREIDFYLLGNDVADNLNPWDIELKVNKYRKDANARFVKGDGWVAEFHHNEKAAKAIEENKLLSVFAKSNQGSHYLDFATGKSSLVSVDNFIRKLKGRALYVATICANLQQFAVRKNVNDGCYYIDMKVDTLFKTKIAWDYLSQKEDTIYIDSVPNFKKLIVNSYRQGKLFFSDEAVKFEILEAISINIYK